MITRKLEKTICQSLQAFPVVGLVGARQTGKTTLAKWIAEKSAKASYYLDLERPSDVVRLKEAELFLEEHKQHLVILDEIQRLPELFPILRSLIDDDRRNGRFLLLGSASPDLLRQSSESLAGRIIYHELTPFALNELDNTDETRKRLWLRGGFPNSYLANDDETSCQWRDAFSRTYLERDIPMLGVRIPASTLWRFWQMLSHSHGQVWNASKLAASLGFAATTTSRYLDLLQDTFMARTLHPYFINVKKRMVKSSKVYVRDSGLLHSLLNIRTLDDLWGHPVLGHSWEGWVIEQILAVAPSSWRPFFYRSSGGAEIDLVLERPGSLPPLALEIKHSKSPVPSKGFRSALTDLGVNGYMVCPVDESYPLAGNIRTLPTRQLEILLNLP